MTAATLPVADVDHGEPREAVLTRRDREALFTTGLVIAVAGLGIIGLINSFAAVNEALMPTFGWWAWSATLGIDLGIAVFSLLGLALALVDIRIVWLKLVPWSLVAATIYLNVAGEATWIGRVAHAVLPCLWIVAVEVGVHVLRVENGLASGKRMDRIRFARWVLAPWATLRIWRRMVLWEVTSYPKALERERGRVLALTDLQERYGRRWRRDAPKRTVALYRLGELAPDGLAKALTADPDVQPRKPRGRKRKRLVGGDVAELLPLVRQIAAKVEGEGRNLSRAVLRAELHRVGHGVSNANAGELIRLVKDGGTS